MIIEQYITAPALVSQDLAVGGALAQKFQIRSDAPLGKVVLPLEIDTAGAGVIRVSVYSDNAGVPGSIVDNGESNPVIIADISTGDVAFSFDLRHRPELSKDTTYYLVLEPVYYTSVYVAWKADVATPHYARGKAMSSADGVAWADIGGDFEFTMHSGHRTVVYGDLGDIEALTHGATTEGSYTHTTKPLNITHVVDYLDAASDDIDSLLSSIGIGTPISAAAALTALKSGANYCVAMKIELSKRNTGFTYGETSNRASAFRTLCKHFHDDLTEEGFVVDIIRGDARRSNGITCGTEDVDAAFERGMFDQTL